VISGNMDQKHTLLALSALGHDQRLSIFRLLVKAGSHGMYAGEIATALHSFPNTLSSNLAILTQAGLLTSRREGRSIRYSADMETMRRVMGFLLQDCCGGKPELCEQVLEALVCKC
jgi:ArsR family transcriptional regulator, arsenate/arsenite/antimonite-responsive transcriptional repressor